MNNYVEQCITNYVFVDCMFYFGLLFFLSKLCVNEIYIYNIRQGFPKVLFYLYLIIPIMQFDFLIL